MRAAPATWVRVVLLGTLLSIGLQGCGGGEPKRQWLKFGQPYTEAEFQRDKAECMRGKKLDVDCMRARGWVDVTPDFPAPPAEPSKRPGGGIGY